MQNFFLALISLSFLSCHKPTLVSERPVDVVLIGGGIMSATLGVMLRELQPESTIEMFEKLETVSAESTDAWNNAGTGHAALCELNYTPQRKDGSIDIKKAVEINESFEISKQFWAYEVQQGNLSEPRSFINSVPHMSFVWGDANVDFLRKRHAALTANPLFRGMEFSDDFDQIKRWIPLVMEGRTRKQKVAATRMESGTDVDFGSLTRSLFGYLARTPHTELHLRHEVENIERNEDRAWSLTVKDLATNKTKVLHAKFVFIGAGGGSLPLLEKTGIPEAKGFGGIPVGGQWLVCNNPEVIARHQAKVYGKASVGSPPMSVPHLDARVINGKRSLLFGPFAVFSTKFLKNGSWLDMPASFNRSNLRPMIQAGLENIPLTQYLIRQVLLSPEQRLNALREYFPHARAEDWSLERAGQRVQVVKDDPKHGGILQFGTELVGSRDGSIVALLGASPGASTAASIMLKVIERSFAHQLQTPEWQSRIKEMIPSFGRSLANNPELAKFIRTWTSRTLELRPLQVLPPESRRAASL